MAAGIAAFYCKIPLGHVEAGLRTFNKHAPFPEEVNRRVTGVVTDLHFAPTGLAKENLLREGVRPSTIFVTGNTVVDAMFMILNKIKKNNMEEDIITNLISMYPSLKCIFNNHNLRNTKPRFILVTGHRRENFGTAFENICQALAQISFNHPDVEIIYPVHLNPHVQGPVNHILGRIPRIHLIGPLEYIYFLYLMKQSYLVITDSGGIQEEAPSLGKPVLVLRETTERPEAVNAGMVKMVGTDKEKIVDTVSALLINDKAYRAMVSKFNPYGDGMASDRILKICAHFLKCPV